MQPTQQIDRYPQDLLVDSGEINIAVPEGQDVTGEIVGTDDQSGLYDEGIPRSIERGLSLPPCTGRWLPDALLVVAEGPDPVVS